MNKVEQLKKLAKFSKTFCFEKYNNIADFQGGEFDHPDYVSPWSIGAHNINADLMLVGQDWASSKWLSDPKNLINAKLGRDPELPTNKNIDEYLKFFGLRFSDTYATNAFVYIKKGSMNAYIPKKILYESVRLFLLEQIKIIRPKMIICLGSDTLNTLRKVNDFKSTLIEQGHLNPMPLLGANTYGVYQPGGQGTANAGGKQKAEQQWKFLATEYKNLKLRE